jgi:hypothetical protein
MALAVCVMPGCSNPAGIGVVGPDPVTLPPVIPLTTPPDTTSPDTTPPDTTPPGVITNLAAHTGSDTVKFTWDDPSDSDFDHVEIWYGTSQGATSVTSVPSVPKGTKTSTGTGSSGDVRYYHFIAVDTSGNRSPVVNYKVIFSAPPGPADVTNLAVRITGAGSVEFAWTDPTDPAFDLVKISWTSASSGGGGPDTIPKGTGTHALIGLTESDIYTFTVTACYTGGPDSGGLTVEIPPLPDTTAPGPVMGLNAGDGYFGSVPLTWIDPGDGDFQYAEITCDPFPGSAWMVKKGIQTCTWNGLAGGVEYTFTVTAVDHSGNRSAGVTVTGTPLDTTPPAPVTNLQGKPGDEGVALTWTDPGDADLEWVQIECNEIPGPAQNVYKGIGTYTWENLTKGAWYTFTVTTRDAAGNLGAAVTVGPVPVPLAGGGTISFVKIEGSSPLKWWEIHTFTASGALTFPSGYTSVTTDYLIVAGGGNGGTGLSGSWDYPGGGGAGGLLYKTNETLSLTANAVAVIVGADGEKSAIGTIEVPGGGSGGNPNAMIGGTGGSGGGGSPGSGAAYGVGGTGSNGANDILGHNGGSGSSAAIRYDGGGGGGGAGGAGGNGGNSSAGAGGAPWNAVTAGASWIVNVTGTTEFSRGGNGGLGNAPAGGKAGVNYGDGGSAGNNSNQATGAGHNGIVVIRFLCD